MLRGSLTAFGIWSAIVQSWFVYNEHEYCSETEQAFLKATDDFRGLHVNQSFPCKSNRKRNRVLVVLHPSPSGSSPRQVHQNIGTPLQCGKHSHCHWTLACASSCALQEETSEAGVPHCSATSCKSIAHARLPLWKDESGNLHASLNSAVTAKPRHACACIKSTHPCFLHRQRWHACCQSKEIEQGLTSQCAIDVSRLGR